jgi:hypothetical protein
LKRFSWRAFVGVLVMPSLVLCSAIAPEHLHETDADHPHSLVHRHVAPHVHHDDERGAPTVSDSDGHVLWLDMVSVQQRAFSMVHLSAALMDSATGWLWPQTAWTILRQFDLAPPHGPPRTSQRFRAPPIPSRLS